MQSKIWYCGAFKLQRLENQKAVFGPIKRLQEHLVLTRRTDLLAGDRPRYKMWRNSAIHSLHLIVLYFNTTRLAFQHEAACIRSLQPPTQTEVGQAQTSIERKPRLWKHKRSLPSRHRECSLNVEKLLSSDPRHDPTS